MFVRLDHVGVVAHSFDEAMDVYRDIFGFPLDTERTRLPEGSLFEPENTRIFFVKIGVGETEIEILVPQDTVSGIGRYLAKRGPGLHHLGYAVESVEDESQRLRDVGLLQIDTVGNRGAAFFHPKSALGILTELVPVWRPGRR